jgi:hypothetical protein
MASALVLQFVELVVTQLYEAGLLEFEPDDRDRVVSYVAEKLTNQAQGAQLVTSLGKALATCPEVIECWADDDQLLDAVRKIGTY